MLATSTIAPKSSSAQAFAGMSVMPPAPAQTMGGINMTVDASKPYAQYKLIRRNGSVVGFEPSKIGIAVTKAFLAAGGAQGAASARVREQVESITQAVVNALVRSRPAGGTIHIEDVQDQVELSLMRAGERDVARSYVLYREKRAEAREQERAAKRADTGAGSAAEPILNVLDQGQLRPLDTPKLQALMESACEGLGDHVNAAAIMQQTMRDIYDGVPLDEVYKAAILAARSLIETDPDYTRVTARLLMHTIRAEVLGEEVVQADMAARYASYFPKYIKQGVENELLNAELLQFNLPKLAAALDAQRDMQFTYLGLQTLYDRYFLDRRAHV